MRTLKDFPYKHVLVLGLARSGTAAAKLLLKSGIKVRVNDLQTNKSEDAHFLEKLGAELVLGSHPVSVLEDIDLLVKNPGIPYDHPLIPIAEQRKIPIITEVELAGQVFSGQLIGITGSNGKTTTTTLIAEMFINSNQKVQVAGNIGTVATEVAPIIDEDTKLVMELSSFQLLGVDTFNPHISVLLNLYEAHLDYHKSMANYQQAKFTIFKNQTEQDYLVYNEDDTVVRNAVKKTKSTLAPFSRKQQQLSGAWVDETAIYYCKEKIINREEVVLVGDHQLENILAAICVAKLNGVTNDAIHKTLTTFKGVKHRLQFVENINERLFYNDSKATNLLATQKALLSFTKPIILLAGGLDRGNEFDQLIPYLTNVKSMVLFGETAEKLARIAKRSDIPAVIVDDVEEAAQMAYAQSSQEDIILLSPACASWDQYKSFEERGDMFITSVHTLK